ncbi:MAG: hypothetical protein MZV64_70705 [Ignavibacteriales bacterium]|nr:hypothetical protein [Ignavibacteriales bacterium]
MQRAVQQRFRPGPSRGVGAGEGPRRADPHPEDRSGARPPIRGVPADAAARDGPARPGDAGDAGGPAGADLGRGVRGDPGRGLGGAGARSRRCPGCPGDDAMSGRRRTHPGAAAAPGRDRERPLACSRADVGPRDGPSQPPAGAGGGPPRWATAGPASPGARGCVAGRARRRRRGVRSAAEPPGAVSRDTGPERPARAAPGFPPAGDESRSEHHRLQGRRRQLGPGRGGS